MEGWSLTFYIVQLDFSAAFDRVSHTGLLFKLKSIGEGGSVLSICTEFLSDRRLGEVIIEWSLWSDHYGSLLSLWNDLSRG